MEDERRRIQTLQCRSQLFEVVGSLGEHKQLTAIAQGVLDLGRDHCRTRLLFGPGAEHGLDSGIVLEDRRFPQKVWYDF